MKYIFFGTPDFAAIVLEKLIAAGMPPALVVTNPDKPIGRQKAMTSPPVKRMIKDQGLTTHVIQPEKLSPELFRDQDWDFFLVVAYGKIIPKEILEIPRLGALNVHPSLLPKYRGPTPIQSAILNGDEKTGVSIMLLDEEVDHGPILAQRELQNYEIRSTKYVSLSDALANLGANMLVEILPKYVRGEITPVPQDHAKATFTKKFSTEDAFVPFEDLVSALNGDVEKSARIQRMIRALNPEPGVWTRTTDVQILDLPKNKRVKLLECEVRDGKLILKQVQTEGKQVQNVK